MFEGQITFTDLVEKKEDMKKISQVSRAYLCNLIMDDITSCSYTVYQFVVEVFYEVLLVNEFVEVEIYNIWEYRQDGLHLESQLPYDHSQSFQSFLSSS